MRIVLDTNVLLSGLFTRGVCEVLLDACFAADCGCAVVLCEHILSEFQRNADEKFGATKEKINSALQFLKENAEVVVPMLLSGQVCDADDLPVLGAAVAAKAEFLVTGDAQLRSLGAIEGVRIVGPREMLARLRQ